VNTDFSVSQGVLQFRTCGCHYLLDGFGGVAPIFSVRSGVPFTVSDSTNSLNATTGPYGIPRYAGSTPFVRSSTGAGIPISPNNFDILTLPEHDG
jgi:hypothetical protein